MSAAVVFGATGFLGRGLLRDLLTGPDGDVLVVAAVRSAESGARLRDRLAAGDRSLPSGDRRAIDAGIATHAVIMDLSARRIWVSEGPHLDGQFIMFDLGAMLSGRESGELDFAAEAIAPRQP